MRHNWDHKPADIPGMLPGFCYQGELQGNLIMSRSSDDWQINPLIWSPCQRCDFLGTYYDVIDRDGDFCLSDDSNTFTSIAGKSKHQDSTIHFVCFKRYFFNSDGCSGVKCSFAVDDITTKAQYNDVNLEIKGYLSIWNMEKTITFLSCDHNDPGQLIIQGSDNQDEDHCKNGGLVLHCTASDENSPWHNFKSDAEHWRVDNGDIPCERNITPWSMRFPLYQKMNKLGAKKISAPEKKFTLIGSPLK